MKKQVLTFKVNGLSHDAIVTPNMTLSELLREELGLTGAKESCGVGECGACTVLVEGKPVLSCSALAIAARDKEILTIEGLAASVGKKPGELHPIQQAFVDYGAIQCGFCSPGMILMAKALLDENPGPTREEVQEGLGGNLCRCTGYVKIVDAVLAAADVLRKEAGT
ncbi:MAG: (2Fe-2S)-binding protein [Actinobacteria bacterium]|nr:(2Fe-2S)-binding protein [Actinomycetota bacterium]